MMNRRIASVIVATVSTVVMAACADSTITSPSMAPTARASVITTGTPITMTTGITAVDATADGINWTPAYTVVANPVYGTAPGGGSYVSIRADGADTGPADATNASEIVKLTYRSSFTLPAGAVNASITVNALADNWASVALNGQSFGSMTYFTTYGQWALNFGGSMWSWWPYGNSPSADGYTFTTSTGFVPGVNTLTLPVENWGGPEAVAFSATVTYDVQFITACEKAGTLVTNAGVANSLCVKLNAAAAAQLRGNLTAKAGALDAYRNEVKAQTNKKFIPAANIPALLALADNL
jgi:hypothetical protein